MHFRTSLLLFALAGAMMLLSSASLHNESVGEITFEQYENEVYARAILDKRYLAHALKQEADCPAATMLSHCAPAYVQERVNVLINGSKVALTKVQQELTQRHVILTWKLSSNEPVQSLKVNSTYMLSVSDHATLTVNCFLNERELYYTMSARKPAINVAY